MSLPLASVACLRPGAARASSKINGVQIGVQTYSYRSLRSSSTALSLSDQQRLVDRVVDAMTQDGIDCCEFWIALIEPVRVAYDYGNSGKVPTDPGLVKAREDLRSWRLSRPREILEYSRKKFTDAGINIYSCMYNFSDSCTDEELEAAFDFASMLGTNRMTANPTVATCKRLAPYADKHKVYIGVHNHNFIDDPNEIATADSLVEAMKLSPYLWVTLDIGHFVAGNQDPVQFIRENHARILAVHLKDRYKNDLSPHSDRNTVEWGKGDVPIKEVLQLMKTEKASFPGIIEYEYPGKGTPVEEVKKCLDYARTALA